MGSCSYRGEAWDFRAQRQDAEVPLYPKGQGCTRKCKRRPSLLDLSLLHSYRARLPEGSLMQEDCLDE